MFMVRKLYKYIKLKQHFLSYFKTKSAGSIASTMERS